MPNLSDIFLARAEMPTITLAGVQCYTSDDFDFGGAHAVVGVLGNVDTVSPNYINMKTLYWSMIGASDVSFLSSGSEVTEEITISQGEGSLNIVTIEDLPNLHTLNLPWMGGSTSNYWNGLFIENCPLLETFTNTHGVYIGSGFGSIYGVAVLQITYCPAVRLALLENVRILPDNSGSMDFRNNSWDAATVNETLIFIRDRCIATAAELEFTLTGAFTNTLLIQNNAAPSGAGITAKNDLITYGFTVTTA